MNTKELIELAMQQQMLSDEMIELLSIFNGIEMECNRSKELTWTKIYLLGVELGKQKGVDSTLNNLDFVMKFKLLTPEQKTIIKTKLDEILETQKSR